MDFNKQGVNKGSAVKNLCDTFGIRQDEYMVFGDAMNDLTMLEPARNSWCSERSVPAVKAVCAHTFAPPEEGGVLKILQALADEMSGSC
jgi:hydroxymethylpyrimidine pyrophosphatase-like HAD family hydrolase